MIETATTTTVTCDKCGRLLEVGETFYQVAHSVAECVYDGGAIAGMRPAAEVLAQLCETDYNGARAEIASVAPLALEVPRLTK